MSTETETTKANVPTIKCTWAQLQANAGLSSQDVVQVIDLGRYGFDDDIIRDMREFGLFPQPFLISGATYVAKAAIFGAVNTIMRAMMGVHRDFLIHEEAKAKFEAMVKERGITPEIAHKLATGEINMADLPPASATQEETA